MKHKLMGSGLGLFIVLAALMFFSSPALAASHSAHATAHPQSATRPLDLSGDDCGVPENTIGLTVGDLSTGQIGYVCRDGTGFGGADFKPVVAVTLMNNATVGWFRWYSPAHPEGNYCTLSNTSGINITFSPYDRAGQGVLVTQLYVGAPAPGPSLCG